MGRPKFVPTDEQRAVVTALVRCGVPMERCVAHVANPQTGRPVSPHTFRRAFAREISMALDLANAEVTSNLFRLATSPRESSTTVQAAIFWLRCKAGWKFARDEEVSVPPAGDTSSTFESEAEIEAYIKDLWDRYGRNIRTPDAPVKD